MIKEIKFSEEFQRAFKRLKKRYRSLPEDFKSLMSSLIDNPQQGSELHDDIRKVRISFFLERPWKTWWRLCYYPLNN